MKKLFKTVATAFLMMGLVACSNEEASKKDGVKIGMVTDTGTIDDKSFNQGTWEGIVKYNNDNPDSEIQYITNLFQLTILLLILKFVLT